MELKEKVMNNLKRVLDPELNINVVDLGLIYDVEFPEEGTVLVTMTLTTPGCPLHDSITSGVKYCLEEMDEISNVDVNLVWEPAWSPEKMTPEGLKQLGR
ncbi:metal-sulfur cluster assembly factor [Cytobacillus sp. FJAT-53684]|uniref:Metal-sulfur cluster assembly factor n=1 Tax=Cytobacillus mangrovibacter TaxID=3299024 RepID=A0ABW6JWF5_9BACI